jgi:predicted MPP superfamily phosphohydrolase
MKHADEFDFAGLVERLGPLLAEERLGVELDYRAQIADRGTGSFVENWSSIDSLLEILLKLSGLYWRGLRNAHQIALRQNELFFEGLPASFDGFTILHLSDLHVELSEGAMQSVSEQVDRLDYDVCVLTGDFRAGYGSFQVTLEGMAKVRNSLREPVYGVLGNHDTIRMVLGLEAMGIKILLNESQAISRGNQAIYLAGIDDAHSYRVHDIGKVASQIPKDGFSILLSHTPEIFQEAAEAGFNLLLSGHTHGGQICLPGGIPITLDAVLPRRMGAGSWQFGNMHGYTSVGAGTCILPVRFNCPPEITLHVLRCSRSASTVRREYVPSTAMETK